MSVSLRGRNTLSVGQDGPLPQRAPARLWARGHGYREVWHPLAVLFPTCCSHARRRAPPGCLRFT